MTKEELEKEAKTECFMLTVNTIGIDQRDVELADVMGAEPREKRIAELEAQIEKMKCCGNCAKRGHICVAEEMQGNLCGKNKDKWELRR